MGYGHRWQITNPAVWKAALPKLIEDSHKIVDEARDIGYGDESLLILDVSKGIRLDGGSDGLEIFDIEDGSCKTDRKPYDVAVCGILLRAHQLAPDAIKIRSDGRWRDWSHAATLICRLWPDMEVACPWEEPREEPRGTEPEYCVVMASYGNERVILEFCGHQTTQPHGDDQDQKDYPSSNIQTVPNSRDQTSADGWN